MILCRFFVSFSVFAHKFVVSIFCTLQQRLYNTKHLLLVLSGHHFFTTRHNGVYEEFFRFGNVALICYIYVDVVQTVPFHLFLIIQNVVHIFR